MASLCPHVYMRDEPPSSCIFCGQPKPELEPPRMEMKAERVRGGTRVSVRPRGSIYEISGGTLRENPITCKAEPVRPFVSGSDPGDEDQ